MDGVIGVRSAPGEGSTFWFTARFIKQPEMSHTEGLPAAALDSALAQGTSGAAAPSGMPALPAIAPGSRGRVLMAEDKPEMDGYAATRAIRTREIGGGRHVPIIAMTASALAGDREKCLDAGMNDYISKPIKAPDLYAILRRWNVKAEGEPAVSLQQL